MSVVLTVFCYRKKSLQRWGLIFRLQGNYLPRGADELMWLVIWANKRTRSLATKASRQFIADVWEWSQVSLRNEWWEVWGCQHSQQSPVGGAGRTEVGSLRGGHKSEEQCFRRADSFHKSEAAKRIASSDPATEGSGFGVLQILFRIKKPVLQFRFRIKNHFPSDLEVKQFKGKFWESQQVWGRNAFSLEFEFWVTETFLICWVGKTKNTAGPNGNFLLQFFPICPHQTWKFKHFWGFLT